MRYFKWVIKNWQLVVATGLGLGFLPWLLGEKFRGKGGGTMGSLLAYGVQILWLWLCPAFYLPLTIVAACASYSIGIKTVPETAKYFMSRWGPRKRHNGEVTEYDYNEICIDEVAGQFAAGFPIWLVAYNFKVAALVLTGTLLAFRIWDTAKFWPISLVEKNKKFSPAQQVMLDDWYIGVIISWILLFILLVTT
ncbi:MAG: phosphatidylglycerophosphatase A [Candidatus Magasanikbacteria bacterium]